MTKTDELLELVKQDVKTLPPDFYGDWTIKFLIRGGELVGYNEIEPPKRKRRVEE